MVNKNYSINHDSAIYNIRIIRIYIDYILRNYPHVDIDNILNYTGISRLQLNDYGFWFNQKQANRFHEIIVKETGNINIAQDAPRQLMKSQNLFAQYLMRFKDPESVALNIGKIYAKASIGAKASAKKVGKNKFEIVAKTELGVKEQFFQCQNRIGSLEGVFYFLTHEYPEIIHKECIHRGGEKCKYVVKIKTQNTFLKWTQLKLLISSISLVTALFLLRFYSVKHFLFISLLLFFVLFIIFHYSHLIDNEKLKNNIENLSEVADEHWRELNVSYKTTKLMQEVGSVATVIQNKEEIVASILKVMKKHLDFWRCIILLENNSTKELCYADSYGFTGNEVSVIEKIWSGFKESNNNRVVLRAFKKQKPIMIDNIHGSDIASDVHNIDIAKKFKLESVICVPIVYEGESLGVMVVDNMKSQQSFREGDINLLMAVASQTALSIAHARAFQKLQESEKKHRTLVETIRDIVYTVDLEGRLTYVSPTVVKITGYEDKELLGKEFIEIVGSQYKQLVSQKFAADIKSGETSTYEITIMTRKNGTVPVELNETRLTDANGQYVGRIGVARDITRRYQEETKRQEMEMRALAQDKLASVGEIATGVAHEINQPLSYIKIILESTLDDLEAEEWNKAELSGDFKESLRQVGKITNIISHLRTFGRSDVSTFSAVNLDKVLDDTLILINERLRIRNITIDIYGTEELPRLYANHAKLEQVFVNLMQNSMDAIEEEGRGKIIVSAGVENCEAVITYSDNGAGIDEKLQERIFEPFFTTKEAGKGTGIGLSIVYGIIQEHKGTITCESEKGKGASFEIRLPVYREELAGYPSAINLNA